MGICRGGKRWLSPRKKGNDLGAAENDIAQHFAPAIVKAGAVFVDNSSAFRLNPDVPLVVPEINPQDALNAASPIEAMVS